MDLVDLIKEKAFLGREFLTWLWFKTETAGPDFAGPEVIFMSKMSLESGDGESLACKSKADGLSSLEEAKAGLKNGKKVEQAEISISADDHQWRLTVKAALLEMSGVKLPKTPKAKGDDPDELAGAFLDRAGLLEKVNEIFDGLFGEFLKVRTDAAAWNKELEDIREWITA